MAKKPESIVIRRADQLMDPATRRDFLRLMSVGGMAILAPSVLASCSDDDPPTGNDNDFVSLNLSSDAGILNYAYALEQLEAAFYQQVVTTGTATGLSAAEMTIFTDIRNHEVIHRDSLAAVLGTAKIGNLTPKFGAINFNNRLSILNTAKTFEDLGVSAYNGAGQYLDDVQNLLVAGKIVSVEARHAAVIRDILAPGTASFAGDDIVNATTGLDVVRVPNEVLPLAQPFITQTVTVSAQPS
jgi:hypothetical protein